ncbi:calcium-translocating P-type ATPase, partial [Tothia fuscella]
IATDSDPLAPDPGTEHLFQAENNSFAFSPGQLSKLLNPKNLAALQALGGLDGIEKGLRTNRSTGLSADETNLDGAVTFEEATHGGISNTSSAGPGGLKTASTGQTGSFTDRKRIFKDNRLPEKKAKTIWQLAWIAYNDKVLILLTIAAVVSLALGLYQTFGQKHEPGEAQVEWVEGVAIMAAILIVVVVGTLNDWQKEKQFIKLNRKKDDRVCKLIRSGKTVQISVYDILAGDVMHLEPGDMVPVDGIFIDGHNVKCDESSATGESDLLRKQPADKVMVELREATGETHKLDPFILSGSKVAEGTGTFLVTAVGVNSTFGQTMMSLREESEATPLQAKLNSMAEYIAKLGGASALLLFIILFIKFLIQLKGSRLTPAQKGQEFLQIFIVAVTVVVVAVPEGLPLAVTLALAFATTRMLKDNNLVRVLRSCETMGNATTVCSDKTGTLTENKMSLVAATIGTSVHLGNYSGSPDDIDTKEEDPKALEANVEARASSDASEYLPAQFVSSLAPEVKDLLVNSIVVNSTAFESETGGTFVGSKTETAFLSFAHERMGVTSVQEFRANANIVQMVPFDSANKYMAAVVRTADGRYRAYAKGASEILLGKCTTILQDPATGTATTPLTGEQFELMDHTITVYAGHSLRTIALVYKDFEQWPPAGAVNPDDPTQGDFTKVFGEMVLIGILGIKDPLRAGVNAAVKDCQMAGVVVRMVTGDNILTAKAIAKECGIYTPATGGIVMEGPVFRLLNEEDMEATIPKLQVLARSSPEDKRILVKTLKKIGETVAVTGDGTNDAPALKMADVGFSMGIAGTEVAKEASSIILMDDNFASIIKALMWGRAVNDAVKKFLQFQLTVNITAVLLTFVTAVASATEESVLTAVQLLWVNLIMDTFAALALATDPPTRKILDRKPQRKSAPLITLNMWKMIIGQAIFQLTTTLILHFAGHSILGYESPQETAELKTLVFNTFVWMQIFNEINNRRLDNKLNIFEGIQHNVFFIVINLIMIGGQIMIVFVGGKAFGVVRLTGVQWGISIVLGFLSIPVGVIIRFIPDNYLAHILPRGWQMSLAPETMTAKQLEDGPHNLAFINKYKGGRIRHVRRKVGNKGRKLVGKPPRALTDLGQQEKAIS